MYCVSCVSCIVYGVYHVSRIVYIVYGVYHIFTGEVMYSVSMFNQKNRENLTADVKDLKATSSRRLVLNVRGLDQSLSVAAGAK